MGRAKAERQGGPSECRGTLRAWRAQTRYTDERITLTATAVTLLAGLAEIAAKGAARSGERQPTLSDPWNGPFLGAAVTAGAAPV